MATVQNQKAYESWYESFEGKTESKFMTWYHSYQGKKVVNIVYSLGASVVIIGALFKIMHFPGAGPVLMTGMITEAFLFMIGVLEAPHEEFHWANVFPELIEYGSPEERVARSRDQLGMSPAAGAGAAPAKAGVSALSDSEMEALKGSMNDLAKAAGQLTELSKVATAGVKLGEKMEAASEAAAKYAASANTLGEKSAAVNEAYSAIAANLQNVASDSEACKNGINEMGKKLSSLNSLYELQMNAAQSATDKIKAVGADYEKMQASSAAAAKTQAEFDAAQQKLAQQVADLNKIYGNMLNALA